MKFRNKKSVILIVDDKPENLSVLFSLLNETYEVLAAESGIVALEIIKSSKPDLILLDIMMPDLDGYQLCSILKSNEDTKDIPVIFMSALSETSDKIRGFELGAVDYIIKPFQQEEVVARIKTHLSIKLLTEELSEINKSLEQKVLERTEKLRNEMEEKEKVAAELKESEKRFRTLFEGAPDPILLIDQESGDVMDANQAAADIFDMNLIDLLGTNESLLFSPSEDDQKNNINMPFHSMGRKRVYKNNLLKKNGEKIPVEISVKTLVVGTDLYLLAIIRDISERIKYEEELKQQRNKAEEMNRLKSIFLANMSHELRTPLISILGFSDILIEEIQEEELREMAKDIKKSGDRLLVTFNTLLDLIDLESGKINPNFDRINIRDVLDELSFQFISQSNQKGIKFVVDVEDSTLIYSDRKMTTEILKNIIDNAIKYTDKGEVNITSEIQKTDDEKFVIIKVKDTGIGIKKESQELIFQEFRQGSEGMSRSYEGVGLGLTIAKKFSELVKAEISLESEIGKGSTFFIKFLGAFE